LLDHFVAGYGANFFFQNPGGGTFRNVAQELRVSGGDLSTPIVIAESERLAHPAWIAALPWKSYRFPIEPRRSRPHPAKGFSLKRGSGVIPRPGIFDQAAQHIQSRC
jgi:hypothetical protein